MSKIKEKKIYFALLFVLVFFILAAIVSPSLGQEKSRITSITASSSYANCYLVSGYNEKGYCSLEIKFHNNSSIILDIPKDIDSIDALYAVNLREIYAVVTMPLTDDDIISTYIIKLSANENSKLLFEPMVNLGTFSSFPVISLVKNGEDFFVITENRYYKYTADRLCIFEEAGRTFSDQIKVNDKIYLLSHKVDEENAIIQSSVFEVIPNGVAEDFEYQEIWIRDGIHIVGILSANENELVLIDSTQKIHTIELAN